MILHVDANSFYASCERLFRPDLANRPVVVLSNNDGIIVALSQEAKDLGLKRGDAYFKVRTFCESHNVAAFSSNYTLYADISYRLNSIYSLFAEKNEIYSIDESFLRARHAGRCLACRRDSEDVLSVVLSRAPLEALQVRAVAVHN